MLERSEVFQNTQFRDVGRNAPKGYRPSCKDPGQGRERRKGPGRPDFGSLLAAVALLEGWGRVPSL